MNASSNRTGKKIIDELLEATQSHRVKRISGPENNKIGMSTMSLFNFIFISLFSIIIIENLSCYILVPEPKKTKRKKKDNVEKKEKKTMSLILIEDVRISENIFFF